MNDSGGLESIEPWLGDLVARLKPASRVLLSRRIGMALRRANAKRIAANIEPDGSAMPPRRPRRRLRDSTGKVRQKGKMFRKLRLARSMKIKAGPDDVRLGFASHAAATAAKHHFGQTGYVDTTPSGKQVLAKYPARRLFGFGNQDPDAILQEVIDWLDR